MFSSALPAPFSDCNQALGGDIKMMGNCSISSKLCTALYRWRASLGESGNGWRFSSHMNQRPRIHHFHQLFYVLTLYTRLTRSSWVGVEWARGEGKRERTSGWWQQNTLGKIIITFRFTIWLLRYFNKKGFLKGKKSNYIRKRKYL